MSAPDLDKGGGIATVTTERATQHEPVLEIRGVHKWFGELHVLRGIDLRVNRGEIICLIGPSGSGKSTLLRCVNSLETHDAGTITINGAEIGLETINGEIYRQRERDTAVLRAKCGMVFQQFNLFPHMTAIENVMYGPRRLKSRSESAARTQARELLAQVGLGDKADAYPAKLSGGQQQRVAIARALAMEPEVMLFDEPTSALDPELVGEVLAVIERLADQGITMAIVTHEMSLVHELADLVAFMDHGQIVERGTSAMLDAPKHQRTATFLARLNATSRPGRRPATSRVSENDLEGTTP
ncbi:MAG TPA: amino acid ABC transporter ATP-binding protein [Solirubrobacteraceae bacterium]|nr:amino acid ABC transporter ATP-binding protein [Solirubrobacteraceae bacterium]